ncbi:MAG: basic amino acid ABC transporter substrate-binding protein [Firmicutes bacterium]|nr:basic amino acid ABC transporter substrate-binding protein [Bacillota bacterium]
MKKLLAALLCLALLSGGSAALADTIIMGTNAGFEPFEYIGEDGQPAGFDIEIAKLIAGDMGMELKIEDIYFDGLLAALDVGTIDFIMAAMTITEERKEAALFSTPYFDATQAVIVLEGYDGIKSIDDLLDKKIAVQDGTTGYFLVTETLNVSPSNVAAFKASTDTILELKSGRVDCIVIDSPVAENFLRAHDGMMIVEGLDMAVEEYGAAVKMGNDELLAAINATLEKIMADGTYAALIERFFGGEA